MVNLTHIDSGGNARMVDVAAKTVSERTALAEGHVYLSPPALEALTANTLKKGDPLSVAQLAGIMGAKRTADLIPLCHPLTISKVSVDLTLDPSLPGVKINSTVKSIGQTGVEMEALTATSVAALTIYDMVKAADKTMVIGSIKMLLKDGGKSGRYEAL